MVRFLTLVITVCALSVSACVATPGAPPAAATLPHRFEDQRARETVRQIQLEPMPQSAETLVCRKEAPTGSYVRRERCTTRAQKELDTKEAREWYRSGGRHGGVSLVK